MFGFGRQQIKGKIRLQFSISIVCFSKHLQHFCLALPMEIWKVSHLYCPPVHDLSSLPGNPSLRDLAGLAADATGRMQKVSSLDYRRDRRQSQLCTPGHCHKAAAWRAGTGGTRAVTLGTAHTSICIQWGLWEGDPQPGGVLQLPFANTCCPA